MPWDRSDSPISQAACPTWGSVAEAIQCQPGFGLPSLASASPEGWTDPADRAWLFQALQSTRTGQKGLEEWG